MSRWTLDRRFEPFWLIDIPNDGAPQRVHEQIFIDYTYAAAGCLLVVASRDHVLAWHWTKHETVHAYTQLLRKIAEPLCVVFDGGQGALTAIKACWPNAMILRCLVHAQRVIRRYTTSRPCTDPRKGIYAQALKLTRITTFDQAQEWTLRLHDFGQAFKTLLNEKTSVPKERQTLNNQWEWTHLRVRKAYNSLLHLSRNNWLFTYLQPPPNALDLKRWVSTTNSLEGGISAPNSNASPMRIEAGLGNANEKFSSGTSTPKSNCLTIR